MVIKKSIVFAIISGVLLSFVAFFFFNDISFDPVNIGKNNELKDKVGTNGVGDNSEIIVSEGDIPGGGGSSGGGSSTPSCSLIQISYSLTNFNKTFECQGYVNGVCVNLIANCTMEVSHIDREAGPGEFKIRYKLIEKVSKNVLDNILFEETLSFGQSKVFIAEFYLEDESGINENLDCTFKTESIPKKELCI